MLPVLYTDPTHGHTCLLKERLNSKGELHWSLLLKERCYCQRVVAPTFINLHDCSSTEWKPGQLWFTSNLILLTQRENWTPDILDGLLVRGGYCGKRYNVILVLFLFLFCFVLFCFVCLFVCLFFKRTYNDYILNILVSQLYSIVPRQPTNGKQKQR